MKTAADWRLLSRLSAEQRGVFSKTDLQVALGERHPTAFARRLEALSAEGALRRFMRGWYVAETFELSTLSQRIAPGSTLSFVNVLAQELLIGTRPERQVMATKIGRAGRYSAFGFEIVHLTIAPHLDFGWRVVDGIRTADAEKAVLDVLYFHLRGQRYVFDLYSDVRIERLNARRLRGYLMQYKNPKFVSFAKKVLGLE